MRNVARIIAAVTVIAVASVVPTAVAGPQHKNRYSNTEQVVHPCTGSDDRPAGTVTYNGPLKLWPPNHKYNNATVTWADEDSGDDINVAFSATHDQYDGDTGAEEKGAGNTADDITPAAGQDILATGSYTQAFKIRAERSGRFKQGRTYTIHYDVTFSDSDDDNSSEDATLCSGDFKITVPHDMRPSNR